MAIKTTEVTAFLKFLIETTMFATVDSDGYVVEAATNERIKTKGHPAKDLIVYQEKINDRSAHIVNPLAEGQGMPPGTAWFYLNLRVAAIVRTLLVVEVALKTAYEEKTAEKKKKGEEAKHLHPVMVNLISDIINDVDEKMLDEFEKIRQDTAIHNDFVLIGYRSKSLETKIRIPILDDLDWIPANRLRKKSHAVICKIIYKLLGIENADGLSKFTQKGDTEAPPQISSWLRCLYQYYTQINPALEAVSASMMIDLGVFRNHLDNLVEYANNAKFAVVHAPVEAAAKPQGGLPGTNLPSATGTLPPPPTVARGGQMVKIPGRVLADGTREPDLEVPARPAGFPMMQQPVMGMGMMGMGGVGMQQPAFGAGLTGGNMMGLQPAFGAGVMSMGGMGNMNVGMNNLTAFAPGLPMGFR